MGFTSIDGIIFMIPHLSPKRAHEQLDVTRADQDRNACAKEAQWRAHAHILKHVHTLMLVRRHVMMGRSLNISVHQYQCTYI